MATTLCPSAKGGFDPSAQSNGTGRTDAVVAGSIQRTATSRTRSATRTRAATLTEGVSCTSTADALPMTRWLVMTRPVASTTNPDPRESGVQTATTLSCHWGRRSDGSSPFGADLRILSGQFEKSRPAAISTVCVH